MCIDVGLPSDIKQVIMKWINSESKVYTFYPHYYYKRTHDIPNTYYVYILSTVNFSRNTFYYISLIILYWLQRFEVLSTVK